MLTKDVAEVLVPPSYLSVFRALAKVRAHLGDLLRGKKQLLARTPWKG